MVTEEGTDSDPSIKYAPVGIYSVPWLAETAFTAFCKDVVLFVPYSTQSEEPVVVAAVAIVKVVALA
jgi:hypothetical protein